MPEARRAHVDEPRVDLMNAFPGEAPARQHLGAEVFDQGIALADKALDDLPSLRNLRIEADRELAIVEGVEVWRGVELFLSRDLGGCRWLFVERVELRVGVDLFR